MPTPTNLNSITLEDLEGDLTAPQEGVEWSDYGNAFQVGVGQAGAAVQRGVEYLANKADLSGIEDFSSGNARAIEGWTEGQREDYSPAAQQALSTEFATTDTANAAWAVWENGFAPIGLRMAESAPNMLATIGPIGFAVKAGITSRIALAGIEATLAGGLSGSYVAADISKEVEALTPEQLKQVGGYQAYIDAGYTEKEIRSAIKESLQTDTVSGTAAAVGASGAIAGPLLGKIFEGGSKLGARTIRAGAIEMPQEAFEETVENAATNIAFGDPALQGGLEAALSGAAVGGPTAATMAAVTGGKNRRERAIEAGYKEIYKEGDAEKIEFYRTGIRMSMGDKEAAKFFNEVEADAAKELNREKRAVYDEDQEAALKAHGEKPAPVTPEEVATPPKKPATVAPEEIDVDQQLANAAAAEADATAQQTAQADQESAEAGGANDLVGPEQPVVKQGFVGTGLEHFDEAYNATLDDVGIDATKGKPVTTSKGEPSKRPKRYPKERAVALAGMVDDIHESITALKADGYDTTPLENIISAFARNPKGRLPGESIISWFKGRSGNRGYISPYNTKGYKTRKVKNKDGSEGSEVIGFTGHQAIDQFLSDLQTARTEIETAGPQEVIGKPEAATKQSKKVTKTKTAAKKGTSKKKAAKKELSLDESYEDALNKTRELMDNTRGQYKDNPEALAEHDADIELISQEQAKTREAANEPAPKKKGTKGDKAKAVSKSKSKGESEPKPTDTAKPKTTNKPKPKLKLKPKAAEKAKAVSKGKGDLKAASAAENVWKIAQGGAVANVEAVRKSTGVTDQDISIDRIRVLLNTAVKDLPTDGLPANEQAAVKKLKKYALKLVSGGSLDTQAQKVVVENRPPELINPKTGKAYTGTVNKDIKIKLVGKDANEVTAEILDTLGGGDRGELETLVAKAIKDEGGETKLDAYLNSVGTDPATIAQLIQTIQAGRFMLSGGSDLAMDRAEVVANVVNSAAGLDTDGLNALIDTLISMPSEQRLTAQGELVKALVSSYGVSQEAANNLSLLVNEIVGDTGIERETSVTEVMAEANRTGEMPEFYTAFHKKLKGWGLRQDLFIENKEVYQQRYAAGIMLANMAETLGANREVPLTLMNNIIMGTLHKGDPLRAVLAKINKLGYGDTSVQGTSRTDAAGSFLQGIDNAGVIHRIVQLSTDLANSVQTDGNVDASLYMVETFAHELVHMATNNALDGNPQLRKKFDGLLEATRAEFAKQGQDAYGLTNVHEFVAEAFSNASFMADLNRIQSPTTPGNNLWMDFIELIKQVLGINAKQGTILHEVVALTDDVFTEKSESDRLAGNVDKSYDSKRTDKKTYKAINRNINELMEIENKGENAIDEDWYGPTGTIEQQLAELERIYDKGEKNLIIKAIPKPKDIKYKRHMNSRLDEFSSRAGGVLVNMMGNDGRQKYDDIATAISAGKDHGRSFGMGMMMLDQMETTYKKLFDGLMPKDINLVQAASYRDLNNPMHVLIRAWQNRQAAAKKFEADNDKLLTDIEAMERNTKRNGSKPSIAEQVKTMYQIAHDATMAEIHPDLPWGDSKNESFHKRKRDAGTAKNVHSRARDDFNKLDKDVQDMYVRMRNFFSDTQAKARTKLIAGIVHKYDLNAFENMPGGIQLSDAMTHDEIDALELDEYTEHSDAIKKALKSVNGRTLPNGPYFPLMRYGDYVIEAELRTRHTFKLKDYKNKTAMKKAITAFKDRMRAERQGSKFENSSTSPTGDESFDHYEYVFSTEDTKVRAEQRRSELVDNGYNVGEIRIKGDRDFGNMDMAPQIMALAERNLKGGAKDKEAARIALREAMITLLPDTAAQKRLLKRTNKAGASVDMGRGLANYMKAAGWSLANLDYIGDISDVTHALNNADQIAGRDSAKNYTSEQLITMKQVANELQSRAANSNTPGKITEWASKLGFFNYLFSVSYSVVNSTQPILVALPWLGGQHGTRKSAAALANAYKMVSGKIAKEAWAAKFGGMAFSSKGVNANEIVTDIRNMIAEGGNQAAADMIGELQAEDIIGATFTLEIAEAAKGRGRHGKLSKGFQKVMEMGRTMPHIVEIMNRTTTAIAAYNLAKAEGKSEKDAREHARMAVRKTQFDYSELNRPRYFVKNDLLRAMTMFKIHPLGIYGLLIGNVKTLMSKDSTKQEGREAGKALTLLLATHGAFAGAAGSLLMEPIKLAMGLLAVAFDDDDEMKKWLKEPEIAMRQFLFEATGSRAASEAAVYGLPRLLGVDMHTRLGLQSLMLMQSHEGDTPFERTMNSITGSLTGPILGMEGGFVRTAASLANGQGWAKAMEYSMPKGIRDIQRAARYGSEGMTDFNGNKIQNAENFSAKDLAIRALGFSPSVEAETYLGRGFKQRHTGRLLRKAKAIANRWKDASPAERTDMWNGEIKDFNAALSPAERMQYRITRGSLQRSIQARKRRERETVKGVHYKRKERAIKDELDFINI